jgi:hypothetical protein
MQNVNELELKFCFINVGFLCLQWIFSMLSFFSSFPFLLYKAQTCMNMHEYICTYITVMILTCTEFRLCKTFQNRSIVWVGELLYKEVHNIKKSSYYNECIKQVDSCCNTSDVYSKSAWFISQLGHWVFWMKLSWFSLVFQPDSGIIP